jgi:pimeloyl-ACP methyl ester carboxylesterase
VTAVMEDGREPEDIKPEDIKPEDIAAQDIAAQARTVFVDGIPMSGLIAEVAEPRAVIVALHGGATTSAYYDSRVHPRASLLRLGAALGYTVIALDRPGYGASRKHAAAAAVATPQGRADLTFAAIDAFLPAPGTSPRPRRHASPTAGSSAARGAGVLVMAHSMGCVLATRMAASPRGAELLGLEIAGTGRVPHPEAAFMGPLTSPEGPGSRRPRRATLREALWTPEFLYPDGADTALPLAPGPSYEGTDVRGWIAEFPRLAALVRVPVHYTLGEYERVWSSDDAALADVASMFTASPRVVTLSQADASHNLSVGWTALSYHLKILSFAEECAVARARASATAAGNAPDKSPDPDPAC